MTAIEIDPVRDDAGRADEILDSLADNREMAAVVGYFAVVLVTSSLLSPMLGIAWRRSGIAYLLVTFPVELGLLGLPALSVLLLGVWWGLVSLLLVFDTKKRLQGLFLVAGTLTAVFGLCQSGLVCGNLNLFDNLDWLTIGLSVGVLLGGGREIPSLLVDRNAEFRDAARWVFYIGSSLLVVAFLEAYVQYPLEAVGQQVALRGDFGLASPAGRNLLVDAALTGTFVYTLGQFIEYDAETNLFVLGPSESGKTLLLMGAYYQAREGAQNSSDPVPNRDLYSMLGEVDEKLTKIANGDSEVAWPVRGTDPDEWHRVGFEFVYGSAFPKNVDVQTVDYSGEWLEVVPDIVALEGDELSDYVDSQGFDPDVMREIKQGIDAADVLVLTIDVEKHIAGESLEIGEYHEILEQTSNKTVLLVATKSDYLADEFERETGLDPIAEFDEFRDYLEETLTRREQVRSLVDRAAGSTIHPVWYQTRQIHASDGGEDGETNRVPALTEAGRMVPIGFDRLLTHFGRGR